MGTKLIYKLALVMVIIIFVAYQCYGILAQEKATKTYNIQSAKYASKLISKQLKIPEYKEILLKGVDSEYYGEVNELLNLMKHLISSSDIRIESKISEVESRVIIGTNKSGYNIPIENDSMYNRSETFHLIKKTNSGETMTGHTPIKNESGDIIGLITVEYKSGDCYGLSYAYTLRFILERAILTLILVVVYVLTIMQREERDSQLVQFHRDIVQALTTSLGMKSKYTCKHSTLVADYAQAIAKRIFKNKRTIEMVKWASLLHDIGKIGISSDILDKPGTLTQEEYEEIKNHPNYSKEILEAIFNDKTSPGAKAGFAIISDIAKYHHERWDGTGYPEKLQGEKIPLMARIVSVADSYEAMTSERPYKKPMPREEAIREIEIQSGRQFDPGIVDAFMECVKLGKI